VDGFRRNEWSRWPEYASASTIELDLPQVSDRQQSFEAEFRRQARRVGLEARETRGSNGARFLDLDLDAQSLETPAMVQEFLSALSGVDADTVLLFLCHGCE
jgi:hypothetical protein